MNQPTYQAILNIPERKPVFSLGVLCNEDEVIGLHFLAPRASVTPRLALAREVVRQLRAYVADPSFEFGLPLAPAGTPFQRRVWEAIAAIPIGQTSSYGELAKSIHSAPRAVGGACGANPYPVVVPCHRVVASGGIGGFGGARDGLSLDIKRWLLAHEDARWQ